MDHSRILRRLWAAPLLAVALAGQASGQATTYNFFVTGPASWNDTNSWDFFTVPEAEFSELGVIGNGGAAYVDDTPASTGGVVINAGSLEIRSGGSLTAETGEFVDGGIAVNNGLLTVLRGGSLAGESLTSAGGAAGQIVLGETGGAGMANLSVTGGALAGTTRVIGPDVNFSSSGDLTFTSPGRLVAEITGPAHATINVTGTANLGGTLAVEFNGYSPSLGESWDIVSAGALTGSFAVDTSALPDPALGTGYLVQQSGGTASLAYTNQLVLRVDKVSGATEIANLIGDPITLDGYTITSPSGSLSTASWNSLQAQAIGSWDEADNASSTRLTEFSPSGTSMVSVGAPLALGAPYVAATPSAFGEVVSNDLSFEYIAPGAGAVTGQIEYMGPENNLVLTIDPTTGEAAIQNESAFFNVAIDAYTITSGAGLLLTGSWNSLQDQGLGDWDEADNADASRVTEFNPLGETMLTGGGLVLELGALFDVSGDPLDLEDLTFEFTLDDGTQMFGIIALGDLPTGELPGDANMDGMVDIFDVAVVSNNWGSAGPAGDVNHDGTVDIFDVALISNNWGAMSGGSTTAVPEPGTLALGLLALSPVAMCLRRRRRPAMAANN